MRNDKIIFVSSSKKDLKKLPEEVQGVFAYALQLAALGEKGVGVKPLKGYNGAAILEVKENYKGDTFRAVYTVRFKGIVYVLHVFKKKSKTGISTPKKDVDCINQRLKIATENYKSRI